MKQHIYDYQIPAIFIVEEEVGLSWLYLTDQMAFLQVWRDPFIMGEVFSMVNM
jgi:hypothetical protein